MTTVNERVLIPQVSVINGVDAGGTMQARIEQGFENKLQSSVDGLQVPLKDKWCQYTRGSVVTQDWVQAILILLGTLGNYTFSERKSGVVEATGYIKNTIVNPVIHRMMIRLNENGYAAITFDFECRAADETIGHADQWTLLDDQAAPTYIAAARGGHRFLTTVFDPGGTPLSIYHVTAFEFVLTMGLFKFCADGDVGYTCVDAVMNNMICNGSLSFLDSSIATAQLKAQQLLALAAASLQLTVAQGQGAANKVLTVAGMDFNNFTRTSDNSSANPPNPTGHTITYDVANNVDTQLTLAGVNKILTIA